MIKNLHSEDGRRRLEELYKQGLSDGEIACQVGCSRNFIAKWRARHGLQTRHGNSKSMPMEQALPPEGCELVREFLRMLVYYAGKSEGAKIDVGRFMAEWRKVQYGTSSPGQVKMREAN